MDQIKIRLVGQQIHCKIFKFYPKNRIVTNTFKITNSQGQGQGNLNSQGNNYHNFNMEDRHNSMTNLQILNQDFEKNMKFYNDFSDPNPTNQRNNSGF